MGKTALATQISTSLKNRVDKLCEKRGLTISRLVEDALKEKIDEFNEEEALEQMALKRLSEPGEHSFAEYKKAVGRLKT